MRKMMKDQGVAPSPSKVIFTLKPDGNNPQRRENGNYAAPVETANYFAARSACSITSTCSSGWCKKGVGRIQHGCSNGLLECTVERRKKIQKFENEGDSKPVIFKPLGILVSLGYFTADQGWEVHRALYGVS